MFHKLSLIAFVAPIVSGLVIQIPENPTTGGQVTIHWTNQQGDPSTWSFELINESFNNAFAIANNVDPSLSQITLTLPVIPVGDGYTLEAVNIGNITDVFASTGDFAVGATTTTSSSVVSTSSTRSTTASATGSTTVTSATSTAPPFTSVIVSSAPTTTSSAVSSGSASTTTTAAITPSSAALSSRMSLGGSMGGFVVAALSAAAGVAMIAL